MSGTKQRRGAEDAGIGDPYWYEWTVGILWLIRMLDPDEGITSVTFQANTIQGWDDVVINMATPPHQRLQIKHTRIDDTLTFNDLVATNDKDESLLSTLFAAWLNGQSNEEEWHPVLFTNRTAGSRKYLDNPPLDSFLEWMPGALNGQASLADVDVPQNWEAAWSRWCDQLGDDQASALSFLQSIRFYCGREG